MAAYLILTSICYLTLGLVLGLWLTRANAGTLVSLTGTVAPHAIPPVAEATIEPNESANHSLNDDDSEPIPAEKKFIQLSEGITIPTAELPQAWIEALSDCHECKSFVEASAQVLRLEVGHYRDSLMEVDTEVRAWLKNHAATDSDLADPTDEAAADVELAASKQSNSDPQATVAEPKLAAIIERLGTINRDWLVRQNEATATLNAQTADLDDLQDLAEELQHVLLGQIAQIETTDSNLSQMGHATVADRRAARQILRELDKLLALAHELRDLMLETLTTVLAREGRLDGWAKEHLLDAPSGLRNRAGAEQLLIQWWRDDPNRTRDLSCVMFDLDGFSKVNDKIGCRAGDEVLSSTARLIGDCMRKNRGHDYYTRIGGQRFLVLLGDTGPRGACSFAERVRQTLQHFVFEYGADSIELTLTAAVTPVLASDNSVGLFVRMQRAIDFARKERRNCTIMDAGAGPEYIEAPQFEIATK